MTPALFARELAAALAASLPEGFTASAEGALVTIEPPDGAGVTSALDIESDEIGDADVYLDAAESMLSLAQDVVCESLDATWPSSGGVSVDLPIPGARIDGDMLRMWYGDEDAPVLELPAVRL